MRVQMEIQQSTIPLNSIYFVMPQKPKCASEGSTICSHCHWSWNPHTPQKGRYLIAAEEGTSIRNFHFIIFVKHLLFFSGIKTLKLCDGLQFEDEFKCFASVNLFLCGLRALAWRMRVQQRTNRVDTTPSDTRTRPQLPGGSLQVQLRGGFPDVRSLN